MKKINLNLAVIVLTLTLTFFSSCNNGASGTGTEPEPIIISSPIANLTKIFVSSPGDSDAATGDSSVRITGIDDAVQPESTVIATNTSNGNSETTTASSTGAFQIQIASASGDELSLAVTSGDQTDLQGFVVAADAPFPLVANHTDIALDGSTGLAYLSLDDSSTHSLTVIDTNTNSTRQQVLLTDPDTQAALTNINGISVFSNISEAMVVDSSLLKIYLVDLNTLTTLPAPIALTDNFATIVTNNSVSISLNSHESETSVRLILQGLATIINESIHDLPDAGTAVYLNGAISDTELDVIFAGTIDGNLTVARFIINSSTFVQSSEEILVLSNGEPAGLVVNTARTQAFITNKTDQNGFGNNHLLKSVSLTGALSLTQSALIAGTPADLSISADGASLFTSQNDLHQIFTIDATTLTRTATTDTGPNPGQISLSANGDKLIVLNGGDDTLSTITLQ